MALKYNSLFLIRQVINSTSNVVLHEKTNCQIQKKNLYLHIKHIFLTN